MIGPPRRDWEIAAPGIVARKLGKGHDLDGIGPELGHMGQALFV